MQDNTTVEDVDTKSKTNNTGSSKEETNSGYINSFKKMEGSKNTTASVQNLDFLLDISLQVTVELGRCKMKIKDLLKLSQGSIIELESAAGSSLDIYVNQKLMAKGEVIVTNDKYGIRLTEIISPVERIENL
ncbi:MAG: flagellar motor switch protein FliN [bacterium]